MTITITITITITQLEAVVKALFGTNASTQALVGVVRNYVIKKYVDEACNS